jgi:large subunit ribosomal protein L19
MTEQENTQQNMPAAEATADMQSQEQNASVAEETAPAEDATVQNLRPGMTVRVHQKITEGDKQRVQVFQGIITAMRGKTPETKTMTVQKSSFGVTVEKIFPTGSPLIEKIQVVKQAKVRRSKLYFLKGYSKRLKETFVKA